MKRRNARNAVAIYCAIGWTSLALALPASASLGDDVASVQRDQAKLQASLQKTSNDRYEIHEMHTPNNTVVREFVSPAGKVFGVTWQGPARPDMQQLLGSYFDHFTQAAQTQKAQRKSRGPIAIREDGLVVEMSGHGRWFAGRAYVPQMVPAGMRAEEVR